MIEKITLLINNKLCINIITLTLKNNMITINLLNNDLLNIIKIPVYNKYNGIDYITINFPLELHIIDNNIFNPYNILYSYNLNIDNDLDFFYNINKIIKVKYKLNILTFDDLLNNNSIIKKTYLIYKDLFIEPTIETLWFNINIIKFYIIYILIKNITKKCPIKLLELVDKIKTIKYSLKNNDNKKTFLEYENNDYLIYNTYINYNFTNEIIKIILNIDDINSNKIINYYTVNRFQNNLIILSTLDDLSILKSNLYSSDFFEYITKKYSTDYNDTFYEILNILFKNYNYPLKSNRHNMNEIFDYLLYFSIYNYKHIINNNKNFNEILNIKINNIIPIKLKNLYINLLKIVDNTINNNYELITYNQKFYNDYLHKNLIKLFISNNNLLSVKLFQSLITTDQYNKFKKIISINQLLIDISYKLTWNNISKKLNYLNYFYKNNNIVYYHDKLNKNILSDNIDIRIRNIIENPYYMYKYLRKEKDFIKWTKFISNKIIEIYYIQISLSLDDFNDIGKLLFLLYEISEQSLSNQTYINFINYCNNHNKLIINNNRINLKIKELLQPLKINLNLGFLAKHLLANKDNISLDSAVYEKSEEVLLLELKVINTSNKYKKYKVKYYQTKNININDETSETSSLTE